jgi:hypothetical protein
MAAVMIWLPAAIGRLAGVPGDVLPETPTGAVNPSPIDVEPVTHTQQQDSEREASPAIRPAPAGLLLGETLISASGKTAVINGLAYREGQLLNQTGYPLRIRSILAGRVILEGDGGLFELRRASVFE